MRWAATYWGVPGSDTDVTDTENTAAAEEVRLFKESCTTPGLTLVPEYFHDVKLQEGLEPVACQDCEPQAGTGPPQAQLQSTQGLHRQD